MTVTVIWGGTGRPVFLRWSVTWLLKEILFWASMIRITRVAQEFKLRVVLGPALLEPLRTPLVSRPEGHTKLSAVHWITGPK